MSTGTILVGLLSALAGGRIYANTFPQEAERPTWPAIRFTVVSEEPYADQCGSETTATDDVRVQLDLVAESYDGVQSLKASVIAAMAAGSPPALREAGGFEAFDAETKTHRVVLDYTLQPSS